MGNFYVTYTIRTVDQPAVVSAVGVRRAIVSPAEGGSIVVLDEASDQQDARIIEPFGCDLSKSLGTAVLAVLNHDDDLIQYWLFTGGQLIDRYNSSPGYFALNPSIITPSGGQAALLCRAFQSGDPDHVEQILRWQWKGMDDDRYVVECERHQALAEALRLPSYGVGFSYRQALRVLDELFPDGGCIKIA